MTHTRKSPTTMLIVLGTAADQQYVPLVAGHTFTAPMV